MFFRCCILACLLLSGVSAWADDEPTRQVAQFQARAGFMSACAISADGKLVLTGEDDGLVTLWSVTSGTSVQKYNGGHDRTVFAAAMLPDGKRAVTCGDDNLVIVWDLATGKRLREMSTGDSTPYVMSCSADGTRVAVGESSGEVSVWDLAEGKRIAGMSRPSPVEDLQPSQRRRVGDPALYLHSPVYGVQFSPDGRTIAAGYEDGQVVLWSAEKFAPKLTIPAQDGASVGALAFSADGSLLVTGNQNGVAAVWNAATGARVSTLAVPQTSPPAPPAFTPFPGSTITPGDYGSVAWVRVFGANAMTAGQNMAPKLWEMKTGRLVATFPDLYDPRFYVARYGFPFAAADVTARGNLLVTEARDKDGSENLVRVWALPSPPAQ